MDQEVLPLIELAKRHTGTLSAALKDRITSQRDDVFTNIDRLQQSNQRFHRAISVARAVSLQLSTILETTGKYPEECPQLVELANIIHRATVEKSKLDDDLISHQKSDRLKAFKQSVAVLMDSGGGPHWISTVSKEEIANLGGEINLLYQLLVNLGAGGTSLQVRRKVDSSTLLKAAERSDLFSTVQRQNLHRRSQQVEELEGKVDMSKVEMSPEGALVPTARLVPPETQSTVAKPTWTCPTCTFVDDSSFGSIHCHACHNPCTSLQQSETSFVAVAKRRPTKTSNTLAASNPTATTKSCSSNRIWKTGPMAQTVWIRNSDVPDVIGKRGKNRRRVMDETGVNNIYAYQDRVTDDGMCPIERMGNPKAVQNAVAQIEEKVIHKHLPWVIKQQAAATTGITWILDADVPEFIGPRGRHVQKPQAKTGVSCISAMQGQVNEAGMCPIHIKGSNDALQRAIAEIEGRFGGMATARESRPNNNDTGTSGWAMMEISGHQQSCSDEPKPNHAAAEAVFNHAVVGINASSLEPKPAIVESGEALSREAQEAQPASRPFPAVETEARLNIMTSQLESTLGISSIQPPPPPPPQAAAVDTTNGSGNTLLRLLQENQGCLMCTPDAFQLFCSGPGRR
jgi:KH domain